VGVFCGWVGVGVGVGGWVSVGMGVGVSVGLGVGVGGCEPVMLPSPNHTDILVCTCWSTLLCAGACAS